MSAGGGFTVRIAKRAIGVVAWAVALPSYDRQRHASVAPFQMLAATARQCQKAAPRRAFVRGFWRRGRGDGGCVGVSFFSRAVFGAVYTDRRGSVRCCGLIKLWCPLALPTLLNLNPYPELLVLKTASQRAVRRYGT